MRIVSKWKDYYDSVQALGQERSILYIRTKVTEKFDSLGKPSKKSFPLIGVPIISDWFSAKKFQYKFRSFIVGFCGKIYLSVDIEIINTSCAFNSIHACCYSLDAIDHIIEKNCSEQQIYAYKYPKKYLAAKNDWYPQINRPTFERKFSDARKIEDNFKHIFEKYKCPVFVEKYKEFGRVIDWNGNLKQVEFFRVFPAYQAFHEIEKYLGNQANPIKPIPKIDDITMLEAKGFDKRYSFRKDKKKR